MHELSNQLSFSVFIDRFELQKLIYALSHALTHKHDAHDIF